MKFEILVDRHEAANKCTVLPLADRPDFVIRRVELGAVSIPALTGEFMLHHEGPCLSTRRDELAATRLLSLVDSVWKRLPVIIRKIAAPLPKPVSIPPEFVTAYPRRSLVEGRDPSGGLATIEAIFIAAAFARRWDESLLSRYHFAREFLQLNREQFRHYGLGAEAP